MMDDHFYSSQLLEIPLRNLSFNLNPTSRPTEHRSSNVAKLVKPSVSNVRRLSDSPRRKQRRRG